MSHQGSEEAIISWGTPEEHLDRSNVLPPTWIVHPPLGGTFTQPYLSSNHRVLYRLEEWGIMGSGWPHLIYQPLNKPWDCFFYAWHWRTGVYTPRKCFLTSINQQQRGGAKVKRMSSPYTVPRGLRLRFSPNIFSMDIVRSLTLKRSPWTLNSTPSQPPFLLL